MASTDTRPNARPRFGGGAHGLQDRAGRFPRALGTSLQHDPLESTVCTCRVQVRALAVTTRRAKTAGTRGRLSTETETETERLPRSQNALMIVKSGG
jgi:hypothetical protein